MNENQQDVVEALDDGHSNNTDKFKNIKYTIKDSAILIDNASNEIIIEVIDVLHLERIEEDNLIYGLIKSVESNNSKKYTLTD